MPWHHPSIVEYGSMGDISMDDDSVEVLIVPGDNRNDITDGVKKYANLLARLWDLRDPDEITQPPEARP